MTTPYIDPNIVFASDAPAQDKPPAFNNYVKGMDETRLNEGRPTIKQFNFIQQQNDFKFLYIHERGACLPFVEGFPYENNAIVFKDGLIQQKNGASWIIPFMRGSQNLAELTDVAQARTKLDVYSKSEALSKANNLSDLADKSAARANLGVYSKTETDSIAGTPNATETIAGKAKIATAAIAQVGTNDTDFLTPKKLRDALNATTGAPIYAVRGRALISATGELLRSQGAITGSVKTGTGLYSVTVSNPTNLPVYVTTTTADTVANLISAYDTTPTLIYVSSKTTGSGSSRDGSFFIEVSF